VRPLLQIPARSLLIQSIAGVLVENEEAFRTKELLDLFDCRG
jgi:hypothetical protein